MKPVIKNRKDFSKIHSSIPYKTGINAMSISSLTGIPRATVIRKLKKLVKNKLKLSAEDRLWLAVMEDRY